MLILLSILCVLALGILVVLFTMIYTFFKLDFHNWDENLFKDISRRSFEPEKKRYIINGNIIEVDKDVWKKNK